MAGRAASRAAARTGRALLLALLLPAVLAACARSQRAPEAELARAAYRSGEPPSLALITVIRRDIGTGAHSALLIDGSQRVLFDPAGSWRHPRAPERDDLHVGIDDAVLDHFLDYHARITHRVVVQRFAVAPEVAEAARRAAEAHGPARGGFCARSISEILRRLPGFAELRPTFFPTRLMGQVARLTGAPALQLTDDDPADHSSMLVFPSSGGG